MARASNTGLRSPTTRSTRAGTHSTTAASASRPAVRAVGRADGSRQEPTTAAVAATATSGRNPAWSWASTDPATTSAHQPARSPHHTATVAATTSTSHGNAAYGFHGSASISVLTVNNPTTAATCAPTAARVDAPGSRRTSSPSQPRASPPATAVPITMPRNPPRAHHGASQ